MALMVVKTRRANTEIAGRPPAFNGAYPNVIILGGAFGVGKSTISAALAKRLAIPSCIEISSVTHVLAELFSSQQDWQAWNKYSLLSDGEIINKFNRQCQLVKEIVEILTRGALLKSEGTIMVNSHLLPEYLPLDKALFCVLDIPDSKIHENRFTNLTNKTRRRVNIDFKHAQIIQQEILRQAKKYHIPIIDNSGSVAETVAKIVRYFETLA